MRSSVGIPQQVNSFLAQHPTLRQALNITGNVMDFGLGAGLQFANDMTLGAVGWLTGLKWENGSQAFQAGRQTGRVASNVVGAIETATGIATALSRISFIPPTGGVTLACATATGPGAALCLVGGGVAITMVGEVVAVGTAVAVHGGAVVAGNLNQPLLSKGQGSSAASGSARPTPEEIARIEEHLRQFGDDPANRAMIERLKSGEWTEHDQRFFNHEMLETDLMARGMGDREAHLAVLEIQGIPYEPGYEAYLYHPDIIKMYPEYFNPAAYP